VISPVILYGYETCLSHLRKNTHTRVCARKAFQAEHLDAEENCIMRSFFAKCHQVEQLNDKMGRARGIHDETVNACRVLVGKSE